MPVVEAAAMVMLSSRPWSSGSAVPAVSVSGIVTSSASASESVAVTVTGLPSSTGLGDADRLTVGRVSVSVRRKVSLAMRWFENLPVPLMLVMTPCGSVAGLLRENSSPSSVPAS